MSTRAEALAQQFEQANAEVIATVTAFDDAALRTVTHTQGWPVAFAAWHIGNSHTTIMGLIEVVAGGGALPPITAAVLDAANAGHAAEHADAGRAEVLASLRENGASAAAAIRRLTDEQLDRTAVVEVLGETPLSVAQMIELALIGHARGHLESITESTRAAA